MDTKDQEMKYRLEGLIPSPKPPRRTVNRFDPERELLTSAEVAFYFGIPRATLIYRVTTGKVPPPDVVITSNGHRRWYKDKILRHMRRWEAIEEASDRARDKAVDLVEEPSHELLYASLLWRRASDERKLYRSAYLEAKRQVDAEIAEGQVSVESSNKYEEARREATHSQYRLEEAASYRDYCINKNNMFLEREAFERDTHRVGSRYFELEDLLKGACD